MTKDSSKSVKVINKGGAWGGAYFVAFFGAAVYFVQRSEGFGGFIVALLKAMVWPAYLVHGLFVFLRIQ